MDRDSCHNRIVEVYRNYSTVLTTVEVLIRLAKNDPKYLHVNKLEMRALRALPGALHDVFFVRMFACFESDLRHYWRTAVRDTNPPTEQLLSLVGGQRGISQDTIDAVQEVRKFRNHLVHEQHEAREPITIDVAMGRLRHYLKWLPLEW